MTRNKKIFCCVFSWITVGILLFSVGSISQAAKNHQKKLKIGTSYSVARKGATYRSSNKKIAYVNKQGIVTAKKQGEAVIRIKRGEKITRKKITVVANGKKKKGVGVCTGEMTIRKNKITYALIEIKDTQGSSTTGVENASSKGGRYSYTATMQVKNAGKKDAEKVKMIGEIAGKKTVISFGKIRAGETETATIKGVVSDSQVPELAQENASGVPVDIYYGKIVCQKLQVYSNKMYTSYDYSSNRTSYHWGTVDTTPPVIKGFVKSNSYNQNMPYQVVYSNDKDYDYFQYVKAEDDREGKVSLTVSTKNVNFKKAGTYKITYTAKDKAGNIAKANAKIQVRKIKLVDEIAEEVLSDIIKDKWSVKKKAIAIYNYTRGHISYVGTSNKKSWEKEAVNGIRYGKGDCFTYYSVARALLTRAGIPNIEVTRYRGEGHHWWNMIYVEGGWYHYDCGPRNGGGRFCMLTDAQLKQYSKTHGNKYIWNYKKIPKTPKKKLSTIF